MDSNGANNLVIAMIKQAATEYKQSKSCGDTLTCNLINKQILTNSLVISAGFDDIWKYYIKSL